MPATLSSPVVGSPVTFENLTMVPVFGDAAAHVSFDTLDAAIAARTLHVTEVSDAGHVPEIRVINQGARNVLLIDGEELVGAKQNRTVNISILVPARASVVVPVTCVEAGRWHRVSGKFTSSSQTHYALGRAAKSRDVSQSLQRSGTPTADQQQVWADIAVKAARLQSPSRTGAMADMFERHVKTIDSYAAALAPVEGQVGAIFLLGNRAVGVDFFASSETCRAMLPKIVRGYAVDAMDAAVGETPIGPPSDPPEAVRATAEAFFTRVWSSPRQQFPSIGAGETWRLTSEGISGGVLTEDGAVLHLSAFDTTQLSKPPRPTPFGVPRFPRRHRPPARPAEPPSDDEPARPRPTEEQRNALLAEWARRFADDRKA